MNTKKRMKNNRANLFRLSYSFENIVNRHIHDWLTNILDSLCCDLVVNNPCNHLDGIHDLKETQVPLVIILWINCLLQNIGAICHNTFTYHSCFCHNHLRICPDHSRLIDCHVPCHALEYKCTRSILFHDNFLEVDLDQFLHFLVWFPCLTQSFFVTKCKYKSMNFVH